MVFGISMNVFKRYWMRPIWGLWIVFLTQALSAGPAVEVSDTRRVFYNGEHNAFTDLIEFDGRMFLTFRSCPQGHGVHPSSTIIVLSSSDGSEWQQVARFGVEKRDARDPHFLVFRDRLFVYTGAWYCGDESPKNYELNKHLGFAVYTDDGVNWSGPAMMEGTYGHYIWRAASYGGKAYLCGRRKRNFVETSNRSERDLAIESALLESDDGLIWRKVGLFQEANGDETAFMFDDAGGITAVCRSGNRLNAQVARSSPPYTEWARVDLDRYIGGPLLARWGGRVVVGGRNTAGSESRTSLCWLENDLLTEFASLPSAGDCSYPGFVALNSTEGIVSWYSSHERDSDGQTVTAIYMANLSIKE
jgi:hypothetical protein